MKAKKIFKITFLALLALIAAVLVNTCIYVFAGQYKSVEKLSKGQELSLYECCSIYATHLTMCFVGYPIAPEAARECLKLHFTDKDTVYFNRHNFTGSKKLEEAHSQLIGKPVFTAERRVVLIPVPADSHRTVVRLVNQLTVSHFQLLRT